MHRQIGQPSLAESLLPQTLGRERASGTHPKQDLSRVIRRPKRELVLHPYKDDVPQPLAVIPAKAGIQGWGLVAIRNKHMEMVLAQ